MELYLAAGQTCGVDMSSYETLLGNMPEFIKGTKWTGVNVVRRRMMAVVLKLAEMAKRPTPDLEDDDAVAEFLMSLVSSAQVVDAVCSALGGQKGIGAHELLWDGEKRVVMAKLVGPSVAAASFLCQSALRVSGFSPPPAFFMERDAWVPTRWTNAALFEECASHHLVSEASAWSVALADLFFNLSLPSVALDLLRLDGALAMRGISAGHASQNHPFAAGDAWWGLETDGKVPDCWAPFSIALLTSSVVGVHNGAPFIGGSIRVALNAPYLYSESSTAGG
jgi:hypothetical protein